MKTLFSSFSIVLLLSLVVKSCSFRKAIDADTIDRVVFYAMPKGVESVHTIDSFSLLQTEGRDTVILDRCFINNFINEINQLNQSVQSYQIDLRSGAILQKKDSTIITILFGENNGTIYEGRMMVDRESLFDLIDKYIYAPHTNDYWFPKRIRDQMRYMDRTLQDIFTPKRENSIYDVTE